MRRRRLVPRGTSGKGRLFRAVFAQFGCHKIEKRDWRTLSKAGGRWYIPPAPDRHWPRVAFSGSLSRRIWRGRPRRLPVSRKAFSQGAQRLIAGWSSPVARQAHNLKVASSNLAPATKSSFQVGDLEGFFWRQRSARFNSPRPFLSLAKTSHFMPARSERSPAPAATRFRQRLSRGPRHARSKAQPACPCIGIEGLRGRASGKVR